MSILFIFIPIRIWFCSELCARGRALVRAFTWASFSIRHVFRLLLKCCTESTNNTNHDTTSRRHRRTKKKHCKLKWIFPFVVVVVVHFFCRRICELYIVFVFICRYMLLSRVCNIQTHIKWSITYSTPQPPSAPHKCAPARASDFRHLQHNFRRFIIQNYIMLYGTIYLYVMYGRFLCVFLGFSPWVGFTLFHLRCGLDSQFIQNDCVRIFFFNFPNCFTWFYACLAHWISSVQCAIIFNSFPSE